MVITRNPKRLQGAGIIVSTGQKRFSAHMAAATINIQKGGGMREPCLYKQTTDNPKFNPNTLVEEMKHGLTAH